MLEKMKQCGRWYVEDVHKRGQQAKDKASKSPRIVISPLQMQRTAGCLHVDLGLNIVVALSMIR